MQRLSVRSAMLAAALVCAEPSLAATAGPKELTPGGIALLASHTGDAGVSEKLETALASPRPETRAVAARVVNLGAMNALLPRVVDALAKEKDPEAARELIRTVLSQGGAAFDEVVLAAVRAFSPRLVGDVVRMFARVRGPESLALYFSTLRDLPLRPADRTSFFRLATRGRPEDLTGALSRALGRRDEADWQAILEVSADLPISLDQPVVIQALRSDDDVFRGEAAWYLAKTHERLRAEEAAEALNAVSAQDVSVLPDPELRFGAEMLRRVLGKAAVEDEGWIACLESNPSCHLDTDLQVSPLVDYLTPREREAIARRNHWDKVPGASAGQKKTAQPAIRFLMRSVPGLPRGLAGDLIAATACRSMTTLRLFSVADLTFRVDGLPSHVTLRSAPRETLCQRAAEALFLLSLAPENEWTPPGSEETYVALFDADSYACSEAGVSSLSKPEEPSAPVRVRTQVIAPKRKNRVDPVYPEAARKNGEEGVSLYEAVITATGCVRDIRVLKSSSPLLDVTGLEAVSRWRYAPATLNGRPVSVYLTVTITYNLHR